MPEVSPILDLIQRARPWQVGAVLRKLLRYDHAEHEAGGFRLWLDPSSNFGYRMLTDGFIEPEMTKGIRSILKEGDTFVDLGGNEAWFSLIAGRCVGRSGKVVCIEPQERLWPVILRNFTLNDLPQCRLAPVAAGEGERAEMTLAPRVNTGASNMVYRAKPLLHRTQEVMVRPLDRIVEEAGIEFVDLLKVDIEGFELNALRSAPTLLSERRIRNVLIEFHEPQLQALGQSTKMTQDLLRENGFVEVSEAGGIFHYRLKA